MNMLDFLLKMILGAGTVNSMPNPAEISKQILSQLKKVLKSITILFICSVTFCLLMNYLVERILIQMDDGHFQLSNSITFLLTLVIINFALIVWSLKKATAKDEMTQKTPSTDLRVTDSPIETAIAALILDFIKEREGKRNLNEAEKQ